MLKPRNWTPSRPGRSSGGTPTAGRLAALKLIGANFSTLPTCTGAGADILPLERTVAWVKARTEHRAESWPLPQHKMLTVSVSKSLRMALAGHIGLPEVGVALGPADGGCEGMSPPMSGTGTPVGLADGALGAAVGASPEVGAVGPADGVDGAPVGLPPEGGAAGPAEGVEGGGADGRSSMVGTSSGCAGVPMGTADGIDGAEVGVPLEGVAVGPADGVDGAEVGLPPVGDAVGPVGTALGVVGAAVGLPPAVGGAVPVVMQTSSMANCRQHGVLLWISTTGSALQQHGPQYYALQPCCDCAGELLASCPCSASLHQFQASL